MCEGSENQPGTEVWGFEKVACWPLLVVQLRASTFSNAHSREMENKGKGH